MTGMSVISDLSSFYRHSSIAKLDLRVSDRVTIPNRLSDDRIRVASTAIRDRLAMLTAPMAPHEMGSG